LTITDVSNAEIRLDNFIDPYPGSAVSVNMRRRILLETHKKERTFAGATIEDCTLMLSIDVSFSHFLSLREIHIFYVTKCRAVTEIYTVHSSYWHFIFKVLSYN
jgi:hypothetical protein